MVADARNVRMDHRCSLAALPLLLLLLLVARPALSLNKFTDATSSLLGSSALQGVAAAFADVNADRRLDIFVIDAKSRSVDVVIMAKEGVGERKRLVQVPGSAPASEVLVGVIPADYNGDSRLDVALLTGPKAGGGPLSVYVAYGTSNRMKVTAPVKAKHTFTDQPALVEWNGDMIADLLGETSPGNMAVLLGRTNNSFEVERFTGSKWAHPAFTAFVDVNNDNQPDVFLSTKKDGTSGFEVLLKNTDKNMYQPGGHILTIALPTSPTVKVTGSPVFADFKLNGKIEMVLPACEDTNCSKSVLYVYSFGEKKWERANVNFQIGTDDWGFVPPSENPISANLPAPITVRVGDVNGDGYPDLAAVLRRLPAKGGEGRRVALFLGGGGGSWKLEFPMSDTNNVTLAALFDFRDTGRLGLLEVGGSPPTLRAVTQGNTEDSYFLKVMVLSGRCSGAGDCPEGLPPYGMPVPGPIYLYNTERPEGGRQVSKACQVNQASYLALQSPFHIFGLGSFANYIEELQVFLPNARGSPVKREKQFTFIVPKTQLVVIPYPLDEPSRSSYFLLGVGGSRWKSKLFLEPFKDKKVLYVAVALVGTFCVVAIILAILQWRERREDMQEKLQEAQKFHFDAM